MFSSNVFLILSLLVAVSFGKPVTVRNRHSTALVVTIDSVNYTLSSTESVTVELADQWSGSISAVPVGAEVVDGPRTKVELSLSESGDRYSVSLIDGFNLGATIIPKGSISCVPSVCAANILRVCPLDDQVINSNGTVEACRNSPIIMTSLCPLAVVGDLTATNVRFCITATSYNVTFI